MANNNMSVEEYINQNLPFNHITKMESLDTILAEGLLRHKTVRGICVVRSDANDIICEIIDRQLYTLDVDRTTMFALIKLTPVKHNIKICEIVEHPNDEEAAPLYNFINKVKIEIAEDDIIRRDIPIGQWRETRTEIVELTNYWIMAGGTGERHISYIAKVN